MAHYACATAVGGGSGRWPKLVLTRFDFLPQVYAAKGKQRMRTGGNTRMMQQMQQQMVS